MVPVKAPVAAWLAFWAAFAALDYWADKRGRSLSYAARHLFRTHHPAGRATFTVALIGGGVVLHRHIITKETQ